MFRFLVACHSVLIPTSAAENVTVCFDEIEDAASAF